MMCHLMSTDAYDIQIWHQSIWLIFVSKEALGQPVGSILPKKLFLNKRYINFKIPLYF
jgi:hypothetical protein